MKLLIGMGLTFILCYNLHLGMLGSFFCGMIIYTILDSVWDKL